MSSFPSADGSAHIRKLETDGGRGGVYRARTGVGFPFAAAGALVEEACVPTRSSLT